LPGRPLARVLSAFALAAVLVAAAWLRLERGGVVLGDALVMVALASLPTLAVASRRGRLAAALALGASALVAASAAVDVPLSDARPRSGRDFFGPVLDGIRDGFLEYYDTKLPFHPGDFPLMHGLVLLAIFGFTALVGILIASRRPIAAAGALLVALGWPATLMPGDRPLVNGALALAGVLALLFVLRSDRRPVRGLAQAAAVGVALVVVATAASTSEAVAKNGFLSWQSWDPYDRPDDPVNVRYVWEANYDGIAFPEKKTTVLKIRVPGPRRSLYWRATTLDEFTTEVWRERLEYAGVVGDRVEVTNVDPLLPEAAHDDQDWLRQDVRVEALQDSHLVGSAQVVRWETGTTTPAGVATNGVVTLGEDLERGQRYSVWSYVPRVGPKELGGAGTTYPAEAGEYLRVTPDDEVAPLPTFGSPRRDAAVRRLFANEEYLDAYRPMYATARNVTREAGSPYEAAVLLEAWFRGAEGGFVYDESPGVTAITEGPPLARFLEVKRGYCQHFAGAMALMLRYLGVPARVAAGFTSGTYDVRKHEWTVTDHNAHTWVEVYFPEYGWIPFDPTPNRGQLSASYTPFSTGFDAAEASALGGLRRVPEIAAQIDRATGLERREPSPRGGGGGVPGAVAETGRSLLGLALLVVAIGVCGIVIVKELRRRSRFLTGDPRALATACRRDLVGFVADQGLEPPPSATTSELGELVERRFAVDAGPFVGAVTLARYARPAEGSASVRRARAELRRLRARIRHDLTLVQRVRGAVSLRSLTA
jgi:protein-glutamine gamma-glutamyltransferase